MKGGERGRKNEKGEGGGQKTERPGGGYRNNIGDVPNTVSERTPNSVNFLALTEFRGESSVSSSALYVCVCQCELTEFLKDSPSLPQNSVSSLFGNSTLEIVFLTFPNNTGFMDNLCGFVFVKGGQEGKRERENQNGED